MEVSQRLVSMVRLKLRGRLGGVLGRGLMSCLRKREELGKRRRRERGGLGKG